MKKLSQVGWAVVLREKEIPIAAANFTDKKGCRQSPFAIFKTFAEAVVAKENGMLARNEWLEGSVEIVEVKIVELPQKKRVR